MIFRLNYLLVLTMLVGSAQGKSVSLLQVDDSESYAESGEFLNEADAKPMSLLEKARLVRERRELYRRSLQGGMSFNNVPTAEPTISGAFKSPEPTVHGGKAGPYRTLTPTRNDVPTAEPTISGAFEPTVPGGKAGPYRTLNPTKDEIEPGTPTAEPTIGLAPRPDGRPRIPAIILIKRKFSHPGDDSNGKGDDGGDYSKGDNGDDSGKGDDGDNYSGKGDDGDDSGKGDDGKSGKGSDGKDGKGSDGKDGKGSDGKDGKGSDGKDGKGSDGKDGKGSDGKDGKGSDGKDGKGDSDAESSEVADDVTAAPKSVPASVPVPVPAPVPATVPGRVPATTPRGGPGGVISLIGGRIADRGNNANAARARRNLRQMSASDSAGSVSRRTTTSASQFDFVVAGFPKCGTTTLLKAFQNHTETDMAPQEQCAIEATGPDAVALEALDATLETLSDAAQVKRGFKCPTAVFDNKSISRVQQHSPAAKFVIGVRHPVWMLQSFYNYRVTEIYERSLHHEHIPSFDEVMSAEEPWKGVSLDATRFELFLMQYAKTDVSPKEVNELMGNDGYDIAIRPNKFEIFLYDMDQLADEDQERSAVFRQELSNFLDLSTPLAPFGRENMNYFVGHASFTETVDICASQYSNLRRHLVEQGVITAQWIIDEFIHSSEVTVANKEHLISSLQTWGTDPCVNGNHQHINGPAAAATSTA